MAFHQSQYPSYPHQTALEDICKYHNPFDPNSSNCIRGPQCHFYHLTLSEFQEIIQSSFNKSGLKKLARDYDKSDNIKCTHLVYKRVLDIDPNNPASHYGYAKSLSNLNQIDQAQKHYLQARQLKPNDDRPHSHYAHFLHSKLKDYHGANTYYLTALKYNNRNPHTHCNYAKLLEEKENPDLVNAEYHYKECLRLDPYQGYGLYNIGVFYHRHKGNLLESKTYFDRLINMVGHHEIKKWWYFYDYAMLLKDMGTSINPSYYKEAIKKLNTALFNTCDDDDINRSLICFQLGWIYDAQQNIASAKFHYGKASELNSRYKQCYQ